MHGQMIYIELGLNNIEETLAFYTTLFHWQFKESFLDEHRYIMFETPDKQFSGGLDERLAPSVDGANIYIAVTDIDTTLASLKDYAHAGILKKKTMISPDNGYYALIKDPSGNKMGILESKQ